MNAPVAFFETQRLRVRAFSPADVEAFVAYRADPDVARYAVLDREWAART